MKMPNQSQIAVPMRPEAVDRVMSRCGALSLLAVRGLAVCSLLSYCPTPAQAADVLPAKESASQPAQAANPAGKPQGHQMRRYQAFARQAELPLITVTNRTMIEVGGVVKIDVARLAQLSTQEKEALTGQFSVPVGIIDKLVERVASNSPPAADQLAQELRTAVIDYKFLQIEWDRYHPPTEGQQTRSNALAALQAGDLANAWELYDGLARPGAPAITRPALPTNLRVVSEP